LQKIDRFLSFHRVKHWEIIADNLSKAGWSWGCVATIDSCGRTIWIADAHRDDGKRFGVHADEKLTTFMELAVIQQFTLDIHGNSGYSALMPTTPREIVTLVIVFVLLCVGLVWMVGQFPKVSRSHVQEYAPTTAAASVAAQQPPTATAMPAPAAQQLRLAAPGVLYPIEYVSSKTNSGVIAFLPGRPLRVVEDRGDTIVVSDGKTKGEVPADKLTNDLDIAALAAHQDAVGQQRLDGYLANRAAMDEALRAQQNAAFDQRQLEIAAYQAAQAKPWGTSLDRGPWHDRGSLSVRQWIYNPEHPESRSPPSNVYYGDYYGRGHYNQN
jgi:hypothetical protein